MIDEIDYSIDGFEDILAKDSRYAAHAYTLLSEVLCSLFDSREHVSGEDILEEFKNSVLDLFGPMSFTVLTEWGLHSCEDIGEMMFNLAEAKRVKKDNDDTSDSFTNGYDFRETFLGPYEV